MTECVKLHLGSGPNVMPGWVNIDLNEGFRPNLVANLGKPFPLKAESIDFIHTEGCLCQLELSAGRQFLAEAWRVLKPGGAMRLLTPDLFGFVKRYVDEYSQQRTDLVDLWNREVHLPLQTESLCEAVNIGIRDLHNFMYDAHLISRLLTETGFDARQVSYMETAYPELGGLDVRTEETAIYLYFECVKPA